MTETREVGQVRFFDHKKGFGFVDVLNKESEHYGEEIFFHFSEINCESSFKKVIPGEVVEFTISKKPGDDSKNVCTNITGAFGCRMLVDNEQFIYRVMKKRTLNRGDEGPDEEPAEEPSEPDEDDEN